MMVEFTDILIAALSVPAGGYILQVIDRVRYKKQNKKLKDNEVEGSSADTEEKQINNDSAQIDLGKKFLEETFAMTQKVQEMMRSSDKARDEYWQKQERTMDEMQKSISKLADDVAEIKEEQRSEIAFLNGDYAAFKEQMKKQNSSRKTMRYSKTKKQAQQ